MTRAVLFDVDGTLVDSNDLHAAAWQQSFRHFGVELPFEAVREQIGKGGDNLIPALLPADLVARCRQEIEDFRSTLFELDYLPRARPFPGVRLLFERLYADGVRIVLATSAHLAELHFHRALIGAEDLIFAATTKDEVDRSKPCPDIFEVALRRAEVSPEQAIVVGDSPWDMEAAARLGLRSVALRCGGFPEAWLVDTGALAVLDGPEHLLACYPGWLEAA